MKKRINLPTVVCIIIISLSNSVILPNSLLVNNVLAESYESNVGLSFTLNPTISINISGDLTIESLAPGDYKDSNIITVTAESNAISGYSLRSTVGSSTNPSTELRKDGTDTTNKFTSLTTNKASLSAFDENNNTWGYSWCSGTCNAGTDPSLWVSGNVGDTSTGYNGLPLYSSSNTITMVDTTEPGSSTISFKIGARATTTQIAGEYTNIINFIGVANPNPVPPGLCTSFLTCMQTMATCPTVATTVTDARDGKTYKIQKLADNKCWLLDNLALNPTNLTYDQLNGTGSDFGKMTNASSTTLNYLKNGGGSSPYTNYAISSTWCKYYNRPCINTSYIDTVPSGAPSGYGSNKVGIYYNYCAVTAGSYCHDSTSSGKATEDLCPYGWHMPTGSTGEYKALYTAYSSNATNFKNALSTPLSGYYYNGASLQGSYGYFWTSSRLNNTTMYRLKISSSEVDAASAGSARTDGQSLRCVKNSS